MLNSESRNLIQMLKNRLRALLNAWESLWERSCMSARLTHDIIKVLIKVRSQ